MRAHWPRIGSGLRLAENGRWRLAWSWEGPGLLAGMNEVKRAERKKEFNNGVKAFEAVLPSLQDGFPTAFPRDPRQTWPLSRSVVDHLALHFGWSRPFAHGVFHRWILTARYCKAVLCRKWRIGLDGARTGERVEKEARERATSRLQEMNRRRLKPLMEAAAREHRREIAKFLEQQRLQEGETDQRLADGTAAPSA